MLLNINPHTKVTAGGRERSHTHNIKKKKKIPLEEKKEREERQERWRGRKELELSAAGQFVLKPFKLWKELRNVFPGAGGRGLRGCNPPCAGSAEAAPWSGTFQREGHLDKGGGSGLWPHPEQAG